MHYQAVVFARVCPAEFGWDSRKIRAGGDVLELFAGGSVGDSLAWLKGNSQHASIDKLNQDADDKVFSLASHCQLFALRVRSGDLEYFFI